MRASIAEVQGVSTLMDDVEIDELGRQHAQIVQSVQKWSQHLQVQMDHFRPDGP